MSALTDLFTAMANKIRSKTGTATTYTPSEMASDGIDDVYDAGVASVPTPTSITPSNSSPVTLTANTAVKPTANGYAISSYDTITPSDDSPVSLSNGAFYKISGGGKAVRTVTNITPSSTPQYFSSGFVAKMNGRGYVIDSYTSETPSNSSPVSLSSGSIYKMGGAGYAIASYSSKTPSDSNPPSVASGDIIKAGGAGYLVKNTPVALYNPDVTWQGNISSKGTKTITVTQTPRLVIHSFARYGDTNGYTVTRINDVLNNKHSDAYYLSSGYGENKNADGLVGLTVSSTSITVNPNRSYTTRNMVFVFY
jgi:hypothetical protein